MDLNELKSKLDRSREIETTVLGVKFRLRLPSEHAWRLATEQNTGKAGMVLQVGVSRELLELSLCGWEGLKVEHLLKGGGEDSVPFTPEARTVLLDECQDIADDLVVFLVKRLNARRKELGAARKNSSSASSGS